MKAPCSVSELRRFLGMTNQLGKFSSKIVEMTKLLRAKQSVWVWGPNQENAFQKIKDELSSNHILTWYDHDAETKISTDASAYGLGAVLLQKYV